MSSSSLVRCSALGGGAYAEGLPDGWTSADIGGPGQVGSAVYDAETKVWTVRGGGADVWDQADHFQFVYQTRGDHFDARARVSSLQNTNPWAKAGLMVRATTDAGSIHAMIVGTPQNGAAVQWRSNTNDYMSHSGVGAADFPNVWVRLTRHGNTVTAYKATDAAGEDWQEVVTLNLALPDAVLVGLCVTAHDDAQLCTATFDGLQVYDVPQGSGTGLAGTYSNDTNFSDPVLARVDPVVDFNWGGGAPDSAVNADFFTVRWQGQVEAQFSETYTFTTRTDDGVRLWVDGQLLVDKWVGQGATEWSGSVALVAGQKYDLKMEYVEFWGDAVAQLSWNSPSTPKQIVPQSQLYPDPEIRVAPTVVSTAPADGGQLDQLAAAISVTFSRPMNHGATESAFALIVGQASPPIAGSFSWDGNTMTFVPTSLLAAQTLYTATVSAGARDIAGNALAAEYSFSFTTGISPGSGDGLAGYYSNSRDFAEVALSRADPTVNFNWGQGSPDAAVNSDNFTARWLGQLEARFDAEYTFYVRSDDGARLWVNGQLLVDKWQDQGATEWSGTITLQAGVKYDLKLEYYENGGDASCVLSWSCPLTPKQVIPQSQLYSTGGAMFIGDGTGLSAQYFENPDLVGTPPLTRVDPVVNFDWGQGAPDEGFPTDNFSIRWVGQVQACYSGPTTFYVRADDGVILWVNNQLLVNQWKPQSATEYAATVNMVAGEKVPIRIEYFERTGDATINLSWSGPMLLKSIVPKSQLYPAGSMSANIPNASPVSPVFIEGRFLSADGQAGGIAVTGPSGEATVNYLGETGFYANVPLAANAPSSVTVTQAATGKVVTGEIAWTPTDLAELTDSQDTILIRKDDSLLLTASGAGAVLTIDADGDGNVDFTGAPGDQWSFTYSTPGTYIAKAFIDDVEVGSLTVRVITAGFPLKVACEVGYTRPVDVTSNGAVGTEVFFVPSTVSDIEVAVAEPNANPIVLSAKPLRRGTPKMLARLGSATGPVITEREVDEFRRTNTAEVMLLTEPEDGGAVGKARLTMYPLVVYPDCPEKNPYAVLTFNSPGATFDGGATEMVVSTSEFTLDADGSGFFNYNIHLASGHAPLCVRVRYWQTGSEPQTISFEGYANGPKVTFRVNDRLWCQCKNTDSSIALADLEVNTNEYSPFFDWSFQFQVYLTKEGEAAELGVTHLTVIQTLEWHEVKGELGGGILLSSWSERINALAEKVVE